jgi:hypothetical protein
MRKRKNLDEREIYCDPLVHVYRANDIKEVDVHAIEQDRKNKRLLFQEMSMRKRKNLDQREIYCDPLVHVYRANDIEEVDT